MKMERKIIKNKDQHQTHVYLDKEIHEKLKAEANSEERSVTAQIAFILKSYFNQKGIIQ